MAGLAGVGRERATSLDKITERMESERSSRGSHLGTFWGQRRLGGWRVTQDGGRLFLYMFNDG